MSRDAAQPLFKEPVSEWNQLRLYFVSWLIFYGKIYDIPEGPSQDIIDNDAQLDKWIYEYNIKTRAEKASAGGNAARKGAAKQKNVIRFKGD